MSIISQSFAKRYWPNENPIGHRVLLGRFKGKLIGPSFDEPRARSSALFRIFATCRLTRHSAAHGVGAAGAGGSKAIGAASGVRGSRERRAARRERAAPSDLRSRSAHGARRSRGDDRHRLAVAVVAAFHDGVDGACLRSLALTLTLRRHLRRRCVFGRAAGARDRRSHGARRAPGQRDARSSSAQGMRPAVVGLALGFAGALALSRLLAKMLYGVGPHDPASARPSWRCFSLTVSLLASYLPARRASRVDPLTALRAE